jgi:hypothetical protein
MQTWINAHLPAVCSILGWVFVSLLNAISSYPGPEANKVELGLHIAQDAVSFLSRWHMNQGLFGYLKLPLIQTAIMGPPAKGVTIATTVQKG